MVNVLSLFDGMSCGQIALNRLGIKINNYYASEVDKYAIEITQKNYPDTIQVGDVCKLKGVDFPKIDLLMGGSPCQGFSFANHGNKHLAFDDPRSALFFEFVRLLKEIKPKYFLLENVKMKKEYLEIIDEHMGVKGYKINSSLVSAQHRERYYWTNIPNINQPKDKKLLLKDILENMNDEMKLRKYVLSEKAMDYMNKGNEKYTGKKTRAEHYIKSSNQKSKTVTANIHKGVPYGIIEVENKLNRVGTASDINGLDHMKRIYSAYGKSPTVNTCQGGNLEPKVALTNKLWRRLTVKEMERLQTVPDDYTKGVSNTQRMKLLGNGWTVDVIAHILGNAKW